MHSREGRMAIWAPMLLLLHLFFSPALAVVYDKCGACKAVAGELEESVANERPRNHLDLRHRLDSKGQREGRVIDYKVSELRVVELLDGLCTKMKPYTPSRVGPGQEYWVKVEGGVPDVPEMALNRQQSEIHARAIVEFCGRLLETTEEEVVVVNQRPFKKKKQFESTDTVNHLWKLTEKIRGGEVGTGDFQRVLCQELSNSCKQSSKVVTEEMSEEEAGEDEDIEDDHPGERFGEPMKGSFKEAVSSASDGEL